MAVYRFESFVLDPHAHTLRGPSGLVHLRPRAFNLLTTLVEAHPRLVSKEDLMDRLWDGQEPSESALTQTVSELRSALGDSSSQPRFIETCHRKGYRFKAEIVPVDTGVFHEEASGSKRAPVRQAKRLPRLVAIAAGLAVIGAFVAWHHGFATRRAEPVVVLMDSMAPKGVYDPVTRENHGTNADDISDVLRSLPITTLKETTSPLWDREKNLNDWDPSLIVVHRSCFYDPRDSDDESTARAKRLRAAQQIEGFLDNMSSTCPQTRFLVYSRSFSVGDRQREWERAILTKSPQLEGRLFTLAVTWGTSFRSQENGAAIEQRVRSILKLDQ